MELAKTLIRSVARAFYDTEHILVVDALMIHSALRDDDLALLLGMQVKGLRKLCGKLREDRLLAVHSRSETREGMQRPITKDYYYIDFHLTIDAIKYRIYKITKQVEGMFMPTEEKKDYFCPKCKSRWTQLQVLDNPGPFGFNCHRCGNPLQHADESAADRSGHEKQSRLMSQLNGMLKLLQEIDKTAIPNNDFDAALSVAVPVQRNQQTNPTRHMVPLTTGRAVPTSVKGLATEAPQIEVSLTTSSEKTAAEHAAVAERNAALAAQNALPVWYTNSTVSGEATALGKKEAAAQREREAIGLPAGAAPLKREESEDVKKKGDDKDSAALEAYFAELAAEKEKQAREDREEEEEEEDGSDGDEDEDEGDFEDVTPAPAAGVGNGSDGRNGTDNGNASKGNGYNSASPRAQDDDNEAPGPAAKRVRIEEPPVAAKTEDSKPVDTATAALAPATQEDSEEDEEVEFEDV
ncbi:MAG: hypothetical protein M1819_006877 [Sarea resinae]|nr:MAG: hypothetical protein M1819_006877 [Sarea resinae]